MSGLRVLARAGAGVPLRAAVAASLGELGRALLPHRCALCDASAGPGRSAWCADCAAAFTPLASPLCVLCGLPFGTQGDDDHLCGDCLEAEPRYERHRSWGAYEGGLSRALQAFKFARKTHLAPSLAGLLAEAARAAVDPAEVDLIVSTPMSAARLRAREFNQSAMLADRLARAFGRPHDPFALRRVGDPSPQVGLSGARRRDNVRGTFVAPDRARVDGRVVLLVDDVMTTGATLSDCARALRKAGAARVAAATVARAGALPGRPLREA